MKQGFLSDTSGRLFAAMMAVMIAGAGLVAMLGPGPKTTGILIPGLILFGAVASIMWVGISLQDHGGAALLYLLLGPPLGGLYFAVLMSVVMPAGMGAGIVLFVLAAVPAVIALRPGMSQSASRKSTRAAA